MEPLTDGDDNWNTPLTETSLDGLIPPWISTRGDLNDAEAANISAAYRWLERLSPSTNQIVEVEFLQDLHARMFGDVWTWAGKFRTIDTNRGVYRSDIGVELHKLVRDVKFQLEAHSRETQAVTELCVMFHHRLVAIHSFNNGNGRHARAVADAMAESLGRGLFSWGRSSITTHATTRTLYVEALQAADLGDLTKLLEFADS